MAPPVPSPSEPSTPLRRRDLGVALACIAAGLGFGALVWMRRGPGSAQQYVAGYLIELSLSVDNVFVFALVFQQFNIGPRRQGRLLFWGILGAIVLRSAFLVAGIGAIARFAWIIPVFGAFILVTGIRLAATPANRKSLDPSGRVFRFITRHAPAGLAALIVLETADLVFALDSLPAVLAVTHDLGIAIASNLFAILGLRSLFSVVSAAMHTLRFLNAGLAAILAFVGIKMLAEPWYEIPITASLAVIAGLIALSVASSLAFRKRAGR